MYFVTHPPAPKRNLRQLSTRAIRLVHIHFCCFPTLISVALRHNALDLVIFFHLFVSLFVACLGSQPVLVEGAGALGGKQAELCCPRTALRAFLYQGHPRSD